MKEFLKKYRILLLLAALILIPLGGTLGKYAMEYSLGSVNVTVEAGRKAEYIYDLFYDGKGFYADPDCTLGVCVLKDGSLDVTGTAKTEITKLAQLNGTWSFDGSNKKTQAYSVWIKTAYSVPDDEIIGGPYVVRRYTGNTGNVLTLSGTTAAVSTVVDGSYASSSSAGFKAYYLSSSSGEYKKQNTDGVHLICSGLNHESTLVVLDNGSSLTLNDGADIRNNRISVELTENDPHQGSGIYVGSGCTLTLNDGGKVSGNYLSANSGNNKCIYDFGAGIYVAGTLNMNGGTVTNNFNGKGFGGGISVNGGKAVILGGSISGNRIGSGAPRGYNPTGAGLCLVSGTVTLNKCEISGNTAQNGDGGGVAVFNGTLTMNDGCTIKNNSAKASGGGIAVGYSDGNSHGSSGTFNMTGGSIESNKANNSVHDYERCGVYVGWGKFYMSGGTVKNNGIAGVYQWSGTVRLSGSATVTGHFKYGVYNNRGSLNLSGNAAVTENSGIGICRYGKTLGSISPSAPNATGILKYTYGNIDYDYYDGNTGYYAPSTAGQSLAPIETPAAVDTEPAVETESPAPGEEETPEPDEEEAPEPGKEEAPESGGEVTDPGDAETTEPAAPGETAEAPTEMPAAVTAVQ